MKKITPFAILILLITSCSPKIRSDVNTRPLPTEKAHNYKVKKVKKYGEMTIAKVEKRDYWIKVKNGTKKNDTIALAFRNRFKFKP